MSDRLWICPLDVETIFAFAKEVSLEVLGAAMQLRCWAWHQLPAGSLPDNDEALAAMVGLRRADDPLIDVRDGVYAVSFSRRNP